MVRGPAIGSRTTPKRKEGTSMVEFASPPMIERPAVRWPGGARVAVWLIPNIEYYELSPIPNQATDPYPRNPIPEFLEYGNIDYGSRVGVYRLFDVLDKFEVPVTCSLNMGVPDRFPEIKEAIAARDWEIMSHGLYNTRYHWGLSYNEEREVILDTIASVKRHFGQQMRGFFPPYGSWTENTDQILAELGITYTPDHGADDRPTRTPLDHGSLLRVPYSFDINDGIHFRRHHEVDWFVRSTIDMFDRLYEDGDASGTVMSVPLHAFYMGQPHRIGGLEEILAHFRSRTDVWFATGSEIADAYIERESTDA
ncbi:MAG: polysaccharide deacetylase family protein [Glaciihabitans sp.]|nr:polysaccharide deacetylase family protein [Glaciihabitans sp.]